MCIKCNTTNFHLNIRKKTFSRWGWSATAINSPEGLYHLHSWSYSKPDSIRPWATWFIWPCFEQGVGLDDSWRCPPNSLYDSVKIKNSHGIRDHNLDFGGGWLKLDSFQCKEFSSWMVNQFWELSELDHSTRTKVGSNTMCWCRAENMLQKLFPTGCAVSGEKFLKHSGASQCFWNLQQAVSNLPHTFYKVQTKYGFAMLP